MNRRLTIAALSLVAALLRCPPAGAQLNGENLLGDNGVRSGTQPETGVYIGTLYYRYAADSLEDGRGRTVTLDPSGEGRQTIDAAVPLVYWGTPKKVLGANVAMMAVLPFAAGALEAPGLGVVEEASFGLSDLYVMPLQLGWHARRADAVAGVAFFAPTGRYTAGASDNLGKGMWSTELSAGGTVYLDRTRSVSLATTVFWETHSAKKGAVTIEGVTLDHVTVGDLLTLEGGAGKSFLHGAASVGVAYYAQWKMTPDDLGIGVALPRHRVLGLGPDITIPIATRSKLISLVNVRYLWEHGARVRTQGRSLLVTTTFPVGGIRIPAARQPSRGRTRPS